MMDLDGLLDDLRQEQKKPTVRDKWYAGLAEGLDLENTHEMAAYRLDPCGFAREVLGLTLTPDQEAFLEAVRDYEIVQVKSATGVGKTFALAILAVWVYKCYDRVQVYTAAAPPEANLRTLLWGEIYTLISAHPKLFADDTTAASMKVSRAPKEFIIGVTIPKDSDEEDMETKWSGKHSPVLFFIFDEGDAIPDAVYRGADGCMSGGFVRQIVCYNPKKRQGMAYHREKRQLAKIISMSAFSHPNVITGKNTVPGAVTRNKTVLRVNEWTEPKPIQKEIDSTCWQVPDFLVGESAVRGDGSRTPPLRPGWRVITDNQFYYKVIGDYPTGGVDRLFSEEEIDLAVSKWEQMRATTGGEVLPPRGIKPIMGLDVSAGGPDHHSAGFRYGIWWAPPVTWKDKDPSHAAITAAELYVEKGARECKIDATGVGAGSAGVMARHGLKLGHHINATSVMVGEKARGAAVAADNAAFVVVRDQAYWAVRVAFRNGEIALPPETYNEACRRMHEALRIITYDRDSKGNIKIMDKKSMIRLLDYSPDELECYVLTYAPSKTWFGGI